MINKFFLAKKLTVLMIRIIKILNHFFLQNWPEFRRIGQTSILQVENFAKMSKIRTLAV